MGRPKRHRTSLRIYVHYLGTFINSWAVIDNGVNEL